MHQWMFIITKDFTYKRLINVKIKNRENILSAYLISHTRIKKFVFLVFLSTKNLGRYKA